jgi:hypothetical protein
MSSGCFAVVHESGYGTHATCRDEVLRSALGGKADNS